MDAKQTQRKQAASAGARAHVVVKVFGAFRERLGEGAREVELAPGATVNDLLDTLGAALPDLVADLRKGLSDGYLNVLVDGRNARFLNGLETQLDGGETVSFLPPIGGG